MSLITQLRTVDCLFMKYQETFVPLELIGKDFFSHLSKAKLLEKARNQQFPFACFRIDDSQKAPYFVNIKDLARVLDNQYIDAAKLSGGIK